MSEQSKATEYPFESVNEYGTPITVFICESCGREFSACPAITPERYKNWKGCLADYCDSYDINRDVDIFFDALSDAGLIQSEPIEPR